MSSKRAARNDRDGDGDKKGSGGGKNPTSKAREQEFKRQRGAIACAECRRLKLKCDKTVPCTSCKRRGTASICPNGSLVTGQGTRFVLADTDRLHAKIVGMSDRIRQLEDALADSHVGTDEPHPLLTRDLLDVKSMIDLHSAVDRPPPDETQPDADEDASDALDIFGTLAVREGGGSTFYGRSAGQESLLLGEHDAQPGATPPPPSAGMQGAAGGLPRAVTELAGSFPDASTQHLGLYALENYLPPWERAKTLCTLYLQQAPWFFGAVRERQLHEELLPLFYGDADSAAGAASNTSISAATPHDLALLFVILCYGSLVDDNLPPAPDNQEADRFYLLTRAALALDPVTDHAPTVSTVQALSLMAIYQGLVANEHSIESTWTLFGMATKLGQSVGLHRDSARWKLAPHEVQKRRSLFWEIFITDCWQALATGRSATFSLPFVDCELPQDVDQMLNAEGQPIDSFPHWKARWGKECVSEVVQTILTARPPRYEKIVQLDRKLQAMTLPAYATSPPPQDASLSVLMQHFMPQNYRDLTLLYVHRAYFAQALVDRPLDPLLSSYAPSIMAGYRAATNLLTNLRSAFEKHPAQVARYWVLWTHSFSSAVLLALVPVRAPLSKMAHTALLELEAARDLFEKASPYGGRARKMAPIVRRHWEKATTTFHSARSTAAGHTPELFPPKPDDEFSVFSGATSTVSAPSKPTLRQGTAVYGQQSRIQQQHSQQPSPHDNMSPESITLQASNSSGDLLDTRPGTMASQGSGSGSGSLGESWGDAGTHAALTDQIATFSHSLDARLTAVPAQEWAQSGYSELDSSAGGAPAIYFPPPQGYYPPAQPHPQHPQQQQQHAYPSPQQQSYPTSQQQQQYYAPQVQAQLQPVAGPSHAHVIPSHPHSHVPYGQPAEYASHTIHAQQQQHHRAQVQAQGQGQHYSQAQAQAAQVYAYQQQQQHQQQQQQWSSAPITPVTPQVAQSQLWTVRDTQSQMPPPQVPQIRPPNPRAQDRLLRQSGDYSVTDAWTYLANMQ